MAIRSDIIDLAPLYRGDRWEGVSVQYNEPGVDFTGVTAACFLRRSPDGDVLAELTPGVSVQGLGQLLVTIAMSKVLTKDLPIGTIYGDIELYRSSPPYGPKSWIRFQFDVIGDYTYA